MNFKNSVLRFILPVMVISLLSIVPARAAENSQAQIVQKSTLVVKSMTGTKGIPKSVLHKARAIAIFPSVIKAGVIATGRHGNGVVLKRTGGGWTDPVFASISGGSVGAQAGVTSADIVLIFTGDKGLQEFLKGNFTLGSNVTVAAGPGAQAKASTLPDAQVLLYRSSEGVFAGVAVSGSVVKVDNDADAAFYNKHNITPKEIFQGANVKTPESATKLKNTLQKVSTS